MTFRRGSVSNWRAIFPCTLILSLTACVPSGSGSGSNVNVKANEWTWMSGSNTTGAVGVYGTQGAASAGNGPGSRASAVSWTDSSNNFWLFGGVDSGAAGLNNDFNDLREFNPTSKQWTWVSGSQSVNALGIYGTLGTTAAGNVPGARSYSVSWRDASNNLWLFGGYDGGSGDSTGAQGYFNDLWEFNPTSKEWTWVGGSNTKGAVAIYGTLNVTSASNVPGARLGSVSWIDTGHNNLWLFGGMGIGPAAGTTGYLNDLWWYQQ